MKMLGKYSVALLVGWDESHSSNWSIDGRVDYKGNNDAWQLIDTQPFEWRRCHIAPSYFRQKKRWALDQFDLVFNLISDADQNPRTLEISKRITAPFHRRLINDPTLVRYTRREDIAKALQGIPELEVPRVIRLRRPTRVRLEARLRTEGFRFPAIVRRPGTHTGKVLGLFNDLDELEPVFAQGEKEIILTEFKDFRSPDGLYRKMRFYAIGDEIVFRHLLFSENWNVHAHERSGIMQHRPDLKEEERSLVQGERPDILTRAQDVMRDIKTRIKLDYFGLDCAIGPDGRFVLFEVNATMNFLTMLEDPRYPYLRLCKGRAVSAMTKLLLQRARSH